MHLSNLLVVAGSGRNSGKTTFACKVIGQFSHLGIISVKISPHFHKPSAGLVHIRGNSGYDIYEETSRNSSKDSSRMLLSGAEKAYYIQTTEESLAEAFSEVYSDLDFEKPVICESPSIINYITPGLFVLMIAEQGKNFKNIDELKRKPHLKYTYDQMLKAIRLPISFSNGCWISP